jgi:hypothetical protein
MPNPRNNEFPHQRNMKRIFFLTILFSLFLIPCFAQGKAPKVINYEVSKYPLWGTSINAQGEILVIVQIDNEEFADEAQIKVKCDVKAYIEDEDPGQH